MSSPRITQAVDRGRTRTSNAFRNESGAFDLPSIIVGVVVVGILTAGVLAAVFGVIPFSQDKAAQQDLVSVTTAEGVAKTQHNGYVDGAGLEDLGLVELGSSITVVKTPSGDWCAESVSESGKTFTASTTNPAPREGALCGSIGSGLPSGEPTPEPTPEADLTASWEIQDDYLRGAIAEQMGMGLMESMELTLADAQTLTRLDVHMSHTPYITSLAGLEHATNLELLDISDNELIADFTPLASLDNLTYIKMWGAYEPDMTVIASIDSLRVIDVSWTRGLIDLEPLASMPNLQELYATNMTADTFDPSIFSHLIIFEYGSAPTGP